MVGGEISGDNLLNSIEGIDRIFTYNGSRFDLPFIHCSLGINLTDKFYHHDLMYDCWQRNLRGGLKAVEQQIGIPRRLQGMAGQDAVLLWQRFQNNGDRKALNLLLEYNKEDVINLKVLRERLMTRGHSI